MAQYVKLKEESEEGNNKPLIKKRRSWFSFKTFIIVFLSLFILSSIISSISYSLTPKIAIVPIDGIISTQASNSLLEEYISSRDIATTLYELKDDSSVKAVLLDINSPGGSPVASEEISKAIEAVKEEKPVYALINDVGASGAFWIAVSADKIYASSMSTVGSIGVTSAGLGFEEFIKQYNITYRRQTSGEYKDMGTPYREPTNEENEMIQELLDEIHIKFIEHVATSRNLSVDFVKPYAEGQVFLGSKAKELGFIDEIGYYEDVIAELKANATDIMIVDYGPEPTLFEELGVKSLFKFGTSEASSKIMLK